MERSPHLVSGMMLKVVTMNTPTDGISITFSDAKGKVHGPFVFTEKLAQALHFRLDQLLGYNTEAVLQSYTTSPVDPSAPDPSKELY